MFISENTGFPKVADCHFSLDGSVLKVQVMPSVDEAAEVDTREIATKVGVGTESKSPLTLTLS